ncbi:MAG: SEL1-like repeat protein [Alphaproteobacteria bacterium]|nr:SEL1-like repeat protein [Alphaproteobacteria bacterium]
MRFIITLLVVAFCLPLGLPVAQAASLDELYRDIIRSNNSGYLPMFVKNRQTPDIILDDEEIKNSPKPEMPKLSTPDETIKLSSEFQELSALAKARYNQWLKTIAAVKSNQVTPIELDDIYTRVKENDPKATEILAWMYTKGVGVSTDYVEAFNLYKRAALLNVNNAERNALTVYKAMNETQRRQVKNNL